MLIKKSTPMGILILQEITETKRLKTLYYIIVMLMYYVMTTMWRALNQRGLRRVYAQH